MTSTSTHATGGCAAREVTIGRTLRAIQLENDILYTTVLVDKGADILELVYKPRNINVLGKTPWGLREPARGAAASFNPVSGWLEYYPGGWQLIFPSGGGPSTYKGVQHNFHGEASMAPWEWEIVSEGGAGRTAEVRLTVQLAHSPFRIVRTMRVEPGQPVLTVHEKITNDGGEEMEYMWGHHPSFGPDFLSEACRIDVGARKVLADDEFDGPYNPLEPKRDYDWPNVERDGKTTDMSVVPGRDTPRHILAYFHDFESAWYGITNTELGFGVGLVWPKEVFPYAWFWQEMNASTGYPWYKRAYIMAIEPFTSYPGQGLTTVMEKTGTQRLLKPGESTEVELRAVFYKSSTGVRNIASDGAVSLKEE
jgi:Domain of unknown function (DUF4432)